MFTMVELYPREGRKGEGNWYFTNVISWQSSQPIKQMLHADKEKLIRDERRKLVFHTEPATNAISWQSSQPCKQMQRKKTSLSETRCEPRTSSPHCIGDRH